MSVNKVILVGNVGKDPEVRYLDKNVAVANFSLATTEKGYTMQNGTQVPERTEWHNIVAWRGLAEIAKSLFVKALNCISKVKYKPVPGRKTASKDTQLKSMLKASSC